MSWPTSQDYNEAIQNAATSFADPDLKKGEVVLNSMGLPVPRSGNFADVYEFKTPDGKRWALKLFTRKVAGLQERYAKIDEHLSKAQFPFTVGFKYLAEGIRIRGQWYPLLKMEWVEGFTLNEFVRDNAGRPQYLHALMQMWGKLTALLRDANFAHADLQHGNVLLVPATNGRNVGLRLIDYDGMWVPALAETHSGEVGHPNFQHPLRLKDRLYNADVDRFPHLVIASALRATLIGGKPLWEKYDNGDNLIFKETDLRDPSNAPVFKALWNVHDDVLCALVGKMALATKEPLRKTPWLDDTLFEEGGPKLTAEEEKKVMQFLGVGPHFTATKEVAAPPSPVRNEFSDFEVVEDDTEKAVAPKALTKAKKKAKASQDEKAKSKLPYFIGGGVAALLLLVGIIIGATGGKKDPTPPEVAKVQPKEEPPKIIIPQKKDDTGEPKVVDPPKVEPPKKNDPPKMVDPPIAKNKRPALSLSHNNALTSVRSIPNSRGVLFTVLKNPDIIYVPDLDEDKVIVLGRHEGAARSIAVAPDGKVAISGGDDARLRIWTLPTPRELFALKQHDKPIIACTISPNGERCVTIGEDNQLMEWNIKTGTMLQKTTVPASLCVTYLVDGKSVLLGTQSESGLVVNLTTGATHKLPGHAGAIRAVCAAKSGLVYTAGDDGLIRRWNTDERKVATSKDKHEGFVGGLTLAANENVLVSGGEDKVLIFWDAKTFQVLSRIPIPQALRGISPITDNGELALAMGLDSERGAFRIANINLVPNAAKKDDDPNALVKEVWSVSALAGMLAFAPDGGKIAIANDSSIHFHDAMNGEALPAWKTDSVITRYALCADGTMVASSFDGATRKLFGWDPRTRQTQFQISGDEPISPYFNVSNRIQTIYLPLKSGGVGSFSTKDGKSYQSSSFASSALIMAASTDDGQCMLACAGDGGVYFQSARGLGIRKIANLPRFGTFPVVPVLSPDGKRFIHHVGSKSILVYETESGRQVAALEGHTGNVDTAAFTPDSRHVLSVGDETLRVWDLATGRQIKQVPLFNEGAFRHLAISANGQYAAVSGPSTKGNRLTLLDISKLAGPNAVAKKDPDKSPEFKEIWKQSTVLGGALSFADGGTKVALQHSGGIKFFSVESGANTSMSTQIDNSTASNFHYRPDGSMFVTGFDRDLTRRWFCWDPRTNSRRFEIKDQDIVHRFAHLVEKDKVALIPHRESGIDVHSLVDGKKIEHLDVPGPKSVHSLAGTDDGETVIAFTTDGQVHARLAKNQPWKSVATLTWNNIYPEVRISPDGKYFLNFRSKEGIAVYETATGRLQTTLKGHAGVPNNALFTKDGRILSVGDITCRVWSVATGEQIKQIGLPGEAVNLALSADGSLLATNSSKPNMIVQLWRVPPEGGAAIVKKDNEDLPPKVEPKMDPGAAGSIVKMTLGWKVSPGAGLASVYFSENGEQVFAMKPQGLRILNAKDGSLVEEVKVSDEPANVAVTAPGNLLLFNKKQHIVAWDLVNKKVRFEFPTGAPFRPAVNWKDQTVLIPKDSRVDVYSLKDGAKISFLKPNSTYVGEVACTADGQTTVALANKAILLKMAADREFREVAEKPQGGSQRISLSRDGKYFAYSHDTDPIKIYSVGNEKEPVLLEAGFRPVESIFSNDGERLIVEAQDTSIRLFDVKSGKLLQLLAGPNLGPRTGAAISPDGRSALAFGIDGIQMLNLEFDKEAPTAKVDSKPDPKMVDPKPDPKIAKKDADGGAKKDGPFDATEAKMIAKSESLPELFRGVQYSGDGKKIYALTMKGKLHILDAESLKEESQHDICNEKVFPLAISRKAGTTPERLYILDEQRKLHLFETEKKLLRKEISIDQSLRSGGYYLMNPTPDGSCLFVNELNNSMLLAWDLRLGREMFPAYLQKLRVASIRRTMFSADGQVGCAADSNKLTVWNAKTGQEIRTIDVTEAARSLALSPEANCVIHFSRAGIIAYNYRTGKQLWSILDPENRAPYWNVEAVPNLPAAIASHVDRSINVLDTRNGEVIVKWTNPSSVACIGFSPDGKYAAIGQTSINQVYLYRLPVLASKP